MQLMLLQQPPNVVTKPPPPAQTIIGFTDFNLLPVTLTLSVTFLVVFLLFASPPLTAGQGAAASASHDVSSPPALPRLPAGLGLGDEPAVGRDL